METAAPIESTVPIQSAVPIESTVPSGSTVPIASSVAATGVEVSFTPGANSIPTSDHRTMHRQDLQALIGDHIDEWMALRPGFLQGVYIGESSGAVEFDVYGSQQDVDEFVAAMSARPELAGIAVVLHRAARPATDMPGTRSASSSGR